MYNEFGKLHEVLLGVFPQQEVRVSIDGGFRSVCKQLAKLHEAQLGVFSTATSQGEY